MTASIAILIPCYNEALTIGRVVNEFKRELPDARIVVFDNNSTDATVDEALAHGAEVAYEYKQGKGNVIRTMFREVDAEYYVMVDGDGTYSAAHVHALLAPVLSGKADMVVGSRLGQYSEGAFRSLHHFGNRMIRGLINALFGSRLQDVLSGYRCFNARFVQSVPVLSAGFEVETELTLHALDKGFTVREVPVAYLARPAGSLSKLNTFRDGLLVVKTIVSIFKDYRPLRFFSAVGLTSAALGLGLGSIPVREFLQEGTVEHASTAVLATGLMLISALAFTTGLILDTINRRYREQYQLLSDFVINRAVAARPKVRLAHPVPSARTERGQQNNASTGG